MYIFREITRKSANYISFILSKRNEYKFSLSLE